MTLEEIVWNLEYVTATQYDMTTAAHLLIGGTPRAPFALLNHKARKAQVVAMTIALLNPQFTARFAHEFYRDKLAKDWTYSPRFDEKNKKSPLLTEYDNLPIAVRARDVFVDAVLADMRSQMTDSQREKLTVLKNTAREEVISDAIDALDSEEECICGMCPPKTEQQARRKRGPALDPSMN